MLNSKPARCHGHFGVKSHPEGWGGGGGDRQSGRGLLHSQTSHTRKTTDQHRTTDTRMLNRETNEGNTGGATETMIS